MKYSQRSGGGEMVRTMVIALAIAMVFRIFLFQPFSIPSGSMRPTLLVGDYLFVSKYAYGYSRYSLPWSPNLFDGRIWSGVPERGDVVVFRLPRDVTEDYVKRVIGLPGDRVQVMGGVVHINGVPVRRLLVEESVDSGRAGSRPTVLYRELLPNGAEYEVYDSPGGSGDDTGVYNVPAGHIFVMGDNRDNSTDSRFLTAVGYIPLENLIGRAEMVFFSSSGGRWWEVWRWPETIRWDRLFEGLR